MSKNFVPSALTLAIASVFSMGAMAAEINLTAPGSYNTVDHYIVQKGQTLDGAGQSLSFTNPNSTTQRLTVNGKIVNLKDLAVKAGGFVNNGTISMNGNLSFGAVNAPLPSNPIVNNGQITTGSLSSVWSAGFNNAQGAVLDVQSGTLNLANTFINDGTIIIHEELANFQSSPRVIFGENSVIKGKDGQLVSVKVEKQFENNNKAFEVVNFEANNVRNNGNITAHGDFIAANYYSSQDSKLVVDGTASIGYVTDQAFGSLQAGTLHIVQSAVSNLSSITADKMIIGSSASLNNLQSLSVKNLEVHGNYVAFKFQEGIDQSKKIVNLDSAVFDGKGPYSGIQLFGADLNLKSLTVDSDTKGMINFYEGSKHSAEIGSLDVKEKGTFFVNSKEAPTDTASLNRIVVTEANFADNTSVTQKSGNKGLGLTFKHLTAQGNLDIQSIGKKSELSIENLHAMGGDVTIAQPLTGKSTTVTIEDGASVTMNKGLLTETLSVNLNTMAKRALYVESVAENTKTSVTVDGKFNNKDAKEVIEELNGAIQIGQDDKGAFDYVIGEGDINGQISGTSAGSYHQEKNTKLTGLGAVTALSALTLRHEMNSLTKRMGELRDAPAGVGAWVRGYGSEMEYGAQNVKAKNNSIQVGSDYTFGDWKVGAAFSYTDGESSYDKGSADNKGYGVAVYGTWFVPCGAYVDLMAKYNRLDNDFALNSMNGSYDSSAYGVSAETGYRFNFMDGGVFVEPQVGLAYSRMTGENFVASNGVTVDQDDYDSFIGRVGVRTGFKFPKNKGTIYARVSGVYDFEGAMSAVASKAGQSTKFEEDLGGAWLEMGVGANFNWTKNTYTYVDFERTNGGDVKENYRWNVGVRHNF